jgi:DNA-binding response OmpR family regulator
MAGKIMVIDDHPHMRDILANFLRAGGYGVTLCPDGATALTHLADESFDLIVADLGLPDLHGLELLRRAKALWPRTPLAVITGSGEMMDAKALDRWRIDYLLAKPFTREQFMAVVASALRQRV